MKYWCHKCEEYFDETDENGFPEEYVVACDSNYGRIYYHLTCYEEIIGREE